jgi:hypothetical protein
LSLAFFAIIVTHREWFESRSTGLPTSCLDVTRQISVLNRQDAAQAATGWTSGVRPWQSQNNWVFVGAHQRSLPEAETGDSPGDGSLQEDG